jgi:hypothetical protein
MSCFLPPLAVIFLHAALLGGRDSSPQALDSDAAMLLPVFVLRLSPVVILFVEEMTQSSTSLQLPPEYVILQLRRSASSYEK